MPSVTLHKKTVLNLIGKNISDDELSFAITYLGTDLDSITAEEIIVEVFPNRPDLLSEQGMARAISSFLGFFKGLRSYKTKASSYEVIVKKSAKSVRPYTSCAVVKGLTFSEEFLQQIIQMQEKLHITYGRNRKKCAIGIYPLDKISFPVTLEGKDPNSISFKPLDCKNDVLAIDILETHPTGIAYKSLLEGLKLFPFFIDSKKNVLSMPPIINSETIGKVDVSTKDVFIECSGFSQDVLDKAINIITSTLADMGGDIYAVTVKNDIDSFEKVTPSFECEKISLDETYVNSLLGLSLSKKEVKELLEKMGYAVDSKFMVSVPSYRTDVLHPADLVEDIAIAYGYNNFKPLVPSIATIGKRDSIEMLKTKTAEILSGLSLLEANTYCLTSSEVAKKISKEPFISLANSVTKDYDILRNSVLTSLLDVLKQNKNRELPLGFFEVGFRFLKDETHETKIKEERELAFVYADKSVDYTYARQVLEYYAKEIDIPLTLKTPSKHNDIFMEGRFAEVYVTDVLVGYVGQISPFVITTFDLDFPVAGFSLDFLKISSFLLKSE